MSLIRPFAALRPAPGRAAEVIAPPYDVISQDEARLLAQGRPGSFLHISRAEIDFPIGTDPYSPPVYARARDNLHALQSSGLLIHDPTPGYYAYRLTMRDHLQTGLAFTASVAAYQSGRIRRHELTRPDKEDDRVRQIDALNAQTGPVLLSYRHQPEVAEILAAVAREKSTMDVPGPHDVQHTLWRISDPAQITHLTRLFDAMERLYIADGHHRSAAAARVAAQRQNPNGAAEYFLAVAFPDCEMHIFDYNRVVADLNGLSPADFLSRIAQFGAINPENKPVRPRHAAEYGIYLPGQWYRLEFNPNYIPLDDPVARLDVSLLQVHILAPILGIGDPRRDQRIDFVGGIRGLAELQQRVESGKMAIAFALYPTSMSDLMAVADIGAIMPPKSTWFEPKLADGLLSHVFA